jgi:HK97 family phage portal protein
MYDITSAENWVGSLTNLELAENHPILTPAILFVSKLFSQAEFFTENLRGEQRKRGDFLTKLLNNPNPYQTKEDFLETLMFMQIAQGVAIVAKQKIIGFSEPKALYVLNKDLIKWPEEFIKSPFKKNSKTVMNLSIVYDEKGENIRYKIKDLMFFYDLANGTKQNPFTCASRIDGLRQTLVNTVDSLIAKNIILKSNGKEMISAKKDGYPLNPEEKKQVERIFNRQVGLSHSRKRGIVTKANLEWKSLHIALRDLGLDESTKVDGNIIYTALHIPKDILSLEAKKTTYNNFKESMVSYVQNEMQSFLNNMTAVFNKHFQDSGIILKGSYEHLPIMQFIRLERYDVVKKQADSLRALLSVGVPKEIALEMSGFDPTIELGEMLQAQNSENNDNSNGTEEEEKDWSSFLNKVG